MDIKQLRALVAVAEHRSFSAAAKALHTVQSNVSTHVARLEAELGVQLVDRATTQLTEEGEVVAERARRISGELDAMISDVTSLHDAVSGQVRVGVIGTTARWLVPKLVDNVSIEYPDIRLVILDATTSSQMLQLTAGIIDLAVFSQPIDDVDVESRPLFDEDRIVVAPETHPLAAHDSVGLAELAQHELLLEARGTAFRDEIDQRAADLGVSLKAKAEVDGMRLLASLAFSGFGAAILPASAAPGWLGGEWKRVPINDLPGRSVALGWRRRGLLSTAQRAVADAIAQTVAEGAHSQSGVHPTTEAT